MWQIVKRTRVEQSLCSPQFYVESANLLPLGRAKLDEMEPSQTKAGIYMAINSESDSRRTTAAGALNQSPVSHPQAA